MAVDEALPPKQTPKLLFTMRVRANQQEILRRVAAEKGISQAELIRTALHHYGVPGMLIAA